MPPPKDPRFKPSIQAHSGYRDIAALVHEWVRIERFRPGQRIPTESELCATFGVARVTVRRAIALLIQEGVLEARHGSGTYVVPSYQPPALTPRVQIVSRPLDVWGQGVSFKYLGADKRAADTAELNFFELKPGRRLAVYRYVRIEDSEPVELANFTFSDEIIDLIGTPSEAVQLHLNAYLRERGVLMTRVRRAVGAISADAATAQALDLEIGAPLVHITSACWDQFDRPYQRIESFYRPEAYRVELDITLRQQTLTDLPNIVSLPVPARRKAGN